MKVKEIYSFLDKIAPFNTAAEWDNCGLSVGSLDTEVTKILVALDVTADVIKEAKDMGAELVLTHHPLIFNPVSSVPCDSLVYKAVESGITFVSSHTCLDVSPVGVNACLGEKTGVKNLTRLHGESFLFMGEVEEQTSKSFAESVKSALGGAVTCTLSHKTVKRVAICSGAGGDLIAEASQAGADVLLTGEAKHHEYLLSVQLGVSLVVAGHYETENIICQHLCDLLTDEFKDEIQVQVSKTPSPCEYI